MISFISIFLSLLAGPQTVEFDVSPYVARVEVLLDGETAASLLSPPWTTPIDLGPNLLPHHLEAVAFDRHGNEMERIDQWINTPRPRTELKILVDNQDFPPRSARLLWQSLDSLHPQSILVTLDGMELEIEPSGRITLPSMDPARIHLLQAEIELESETFRTETLIGGELTDSISTELTAIPVIWPHQRLPTVTELNQAFSHQGQPLQVALVERSSSDIFIVQDQRMAVYSKLLDLRVSIKKRTRWSGLEGHDYLRVVFPYASSNLSTVSADLFPITQSLTNKVGIKKFGMLSVIPSIFEGKLNGQQRLSDAVAVAGLRAASGQRRRVVVLITNEVHEDFSRHSEESVLHYLDQLRVPLVVWTVNQSKSPDAPWTERRDISTPNKLIWEIRKVRDLLDSQAIVWVKGFYPIHELNLTNGAPPGLELVSQTTSIARFN